MKFKQIFQDWVLKNWPYKLLAIVFAFLLWLVIMNLQDPEITRTIYNIPVVRENEEVLADIDYVYSVASGETATVLVTGKRSIVRNLTANDFYASANFEELSITNAIPIKVTLTGNKSVYSGDVTIRVQTTSMILTLDDISSKALPVEIEYIGTLAEDKNMDSVVTEPAEIEVTAPSKTLETITRVEVVVNTDDIDNGVSLRATPVFYDYTGSVVDLNADDISSNCSEVVVTFEISTIKTVELRAGTSGTPAEGYEVDSITYSFDNVKIKGDADTLEEISYIRIPNSRISLAGATKDVVEKIDITEYLPENVEIFDNNINVVITVKIKESETTAAQTNAADETESTATADVLETTSGN